VDDSLFMGLLKPAGDTFEEVGDGALSLVPALHHHPTERLAINERHREIMNGADLTDIENGTEIGTAELSGGPCLAIKAIDHLRAGSQNRGLERHMAAQLGVVGEINGSHGATSEQANDLVTSETAAGREHGNVLPG